MDEDVDPGRGERFRDEAADPSLTRRMDDLLRPPPRRLGVLGGTFDPIHMGHLVAASEALDAFELDRVILMVAARPWQKSSYSDAEDRFMMTALAAESHPCFACSRMELDRQGPTYTAETMTALRDFYGSDTELFFIVGADAVMKIGSWVQIEDLAKVAEMIAVARPGFDTRAFRRDPSWPIVHFISMPAIGISSTDVRERVRAGKPIDYLVPAPVVEYISSRSLYEGTEEI